MNKLFGIRGGLILLLLFGANTLSAQIIIEPQVPSQGIVQQSQLWNLLIINNTSDAIHGVIQISFQQANGGAKVFNATSGELFIPKGATQITSGNAGAVRYDYFNSSGSGAGTGGMLPIGQYSVCYNLTLDENKAIGMPSMDCIPITVEPFSPPQLVFPENNSVQSTSYPVLSWLPPMPLNMFTDLNYKLIISEVYDGQAPSIAIQRNPLLFVQGQIKQNSYVYPSSFVALKPGKTYAWQIIAQNGNTYSQATEVWSFIIRKDSLPVLRDDASYPHLQRGAGSSIFEVSEKIKFSYENEAGDSLVTIRLLQMNGSSQLLLNDVPVHLMRGINFIDISPVSFTRLVEGQDYLLEFTNGWKERWSLKFRYAPSHN